MLLFDIIGQCGKEFIEMAVYGSVAIGMPDIDGLSEAGGLDGDAGYISIGGSQYGQVLSSLGAYIQAHVIVIGPELPEIRGQAHGDAEGIAEIALRVRDRREDLRERKEGIKGTGRRE